MSSPQWQQASQIVQAALARPAQERGEFIAKACAGNEPLQQEVEILLRYYAASDNDAATPAIAESTAPLEHWWQPPRKHSKPPAPEPPYEPAPSHPPVAPPPVDWFAGQDPQSIETAREIFRRTTDAFPAPSFDPPSLHVVPPPPAAPPPGKAPGNATTELIGELSKGLEPLYSDAAIHPLPPANGQPTPESGARPAFEAPTVRPVFDPPSQRGQFEQPTFRPLYEGTPKPPTPPPVFDQPSVRPNFDQPSVRPNFDQPSVRPNFDQPSVRPNFDQPSVRPNFDQPSVRPNFDQPSVRPNFDQPSQRPNFDQPSQRTSPEQPQPPNFDQPSGRPNFDQPSQRPNCNQPSQRPSFDQPSQRTGAEQSQRPSFDQSSVRPGAQSQPLDGRQLDGRMLAHYQLQYEIGRGGMGRVYLAQDTRLGRRVALKMLLRHSTRDPERVGRFQQEARAASALNHPNILTIHEIGEYKGVHYLATEYVEGRTLRALIERGRFKLSIAAELGIQVASALESAHRANIVHRDIKPENLMLRPDGYVKVLDFGIAKLIETTLGPPATGKDEPGDNAGQVETKPGVVVGTASYMSPEQARGQRVDRRTDIFSLGIVLYEMITGQCPFKGPTQSDTLAALLTREPLALAQHLPGAPANVLSELQRIISRTLEKDRERRYQSAKELVLELKAFKQMLADPWRSGELEQQAAPATQTDGSPAAEQPTEEVRLEPEMSTAQATESFKKSATGHLAGKLVEARQPFWLRHRNALLLCIAVLMLAALALGAYSYWNRGGGGASIAVLPFEFTQPARADASEAARDREYLADGLTENLIQRLSQVPNLKVIARNSVFRYKGKALDSQTVGQALNVGTVLTGRITPRGAHNEAFTITVELADARTNTILWGQQYESEADNVHLLQSNLADRIAEQLRLRLSGAERERLAQRDTNNVDAYRLYLKGRHFWNQRTGDALKRSIESFQHAVLLDPNYARAYAGLADSYALAPIYSETAPEEARAAGKDAAARALELDPRLAEPHAALGFIRYQYEWNWEGAEQAYQRALALNENYATAHQWCSSLLSSLGRADDALRQAERARELDPVSTPICTNLGAAYYYARRYNEAVQQFQKALELNPNAAGVHAHLGMAYEQQQKYEQAIAAQQRAIALAGDNPQMKLRLARALALAGRADEARKLLDELQQNAAPGTAPLYQVAGIYTALGDKEQALGTLTQAVALREEGIVWLKVDPQFDPVRGDARFAGLLKNIGLAK